MKDQAERLRAMARIVAMRHAQQRQAQRRARVIAVASGKGGVGKTNLSVNLALALREKGLRVGIFDADLGLGNVDVLLGMAPKYTLKDVLDGRKQISEILMPGPQGIVVFAAGSGFMELANLSQWRLDRFVDAISELDQSLDVLLIDNAAGISKSVLSFVSAADEVIVVTTPEPAAYTDAYALVKLLAGRDARTRLRLVVNMARAPHDAERISKRIEAILRQFLPGGFDLTLLGHVCHDAHVSQAVLKRQAFIMAYPKSEAAQNVRSIAQRLIQQPMRPRFGLRALLARLGAAPGGKGR